MKSLKIVHLYASEMNIYGDNGNVIALKKRLQWRGMKGDVVKIGVGEDFDFTSADIVVAGGGQDTNQIEVSKDLKRREANIKKAVDDGVVFLVVCGTYQLFGKGFDSNEYGSLDGIGIFDCKTIAGKKRMIGNVLIDSPFGKLVGFENHSGKTELSSSQRSLGEVIKGNGNNTTSKDEGAIKNNCFGTYMHGSLLPKNPKFTDELLKRALSRKYGEVSLEDLNDDIELMAAKIAASRP